MSWERAIIRPWHSPPSARTLSLRFASCGNRPRSPPRRSPSGCRRRERVVFSVVNAFMLRPLPVSDGQRLVAIAMARAASPALGGVSYPDLYDLASDATNSVCALPSAPRQVIFDGCSSATASFLLHSARSPDLLPRPPLHGPSAACSSPSPCWTFGRLAQRPASSSVPPWSAAVFRHGAPHGSIRWSRCGSIEGPIFSGAAAYKYVFSGAKSTIIASCQRGCDPARFWAGRSGLGAWPEPVEGVEFE